MLDRIHKKIYDVFVKPYLKNYLKKERWFTYNDLKLKIHPGVFHPAYFFSTLVFADFLKTLHLHQKKVCEVGAGSGLLSFIALLNGANVVSFDINATAVNGVKENFKSNFTGKENFEIYLSDLFDTIPKNNFDIFIINPPYFFNDAENESDFAWKCGKNGEYFEKLFDQLEGYSHPSSQIFMILADNCDIERIRKTAKKHHYLLNLVFEKKIKWEKNFIFNIAKEL